MRRVPLNSRAQAAVEYLLTVAAVFVAFGGIAVVFEKQSGSYLSVLFALIQLPF